MIKVLKRDGTVRTYIEEAATDVQAKALNGVDTTSISWSSPVPVSFEIGDYIEIFGEIYTIHVPSNDTGVFKRNYSYQLNFEGQAYKLGRVSYLFLDQFNRFTKPVFFLNATPLSFLQLAVYNMQRAFPEENWQIGNCIDGPVKNIDFSSENCLEAISKVAENFDTEFIVESGNRLSLYRRQANTGLVFTFGPNEALHSITKQSQENSSPINRLYAYGSTKNLGSNYRLGEDRLRMDGQRYVQDNTAIEKEGLFEGTIVFDDIYPHRTGTISSVTSPFIFTDIGMDFDLNDPDILMPGVSAKVVFLSGLLSGYTFEVDDYNNSTKTFTILKNTDEQTVDVPSEGLSPQVGDKYTIVDIIMPEIYIVNAETELKNRALQWLSDNGNPKLKYTIVCNPFWIKRNSPTIRLGDIISISVPEMGINLQSRIIAINRNISKPYIYGLELADTADKNIIVKLITSQ